MTEGNIDGKHYEYPHCNSEVLHAPSTCYYCDHYPDRQKVRAASGTPFTPAESNGWSGNVAVKAGQQHTHLGGTFTAGPTTTPRRGLRGLIERLTEKLT
jgi:hypothetical protein